MVLIAALASSCATIYCLSSINIEDKGGEPVQLTILGVMYMAIYSIPFLMIYIDSALVPEVY